MNTKNMRRVAGLVLQLVSVHAHAEGDGGRDPFPFQAPAQVSAQSRYAADAGHERFPDLTGRPSEMPVPVRMLALAGSEAMVASANTAPVGYDEGTVMFAQARSLERYQAAKQVPVRAAGVAVAGR